MDSLRSVISFIAGESDKTTKSKDRLFAAKSDYGYFVNTKSKNAQRFASALKKILMEQVFYMAV